MIGLHTVPILLTHFNSVIFSCTAPTPLSMSRKHSKNTERQLIDIVNSRSNLNKCGECGSDYPTWASWNLGVLLCGRCANLHKKVLSVEGPRGHPVSRVKSLTLETWSDDQIESLRRIGNKKAKQRWNPIRVPFPHSDDDDAQIEQYLREKYILGSFRHGSVDDDADDNFLRYSNDIHHGSGTLTPASGSRSRLSTLTRRLSRQVPRLLHRKLTTFEQGQYLAQIHKIMSYGYTNRDTVAESVILALGDVDFALDILDHDSRVNPTLEELPPDLPRRPVVSATPSTSSAAVSASAPEWWSAPSSGVTATATGVSGVSGVSGVNGGGVAPNATASGPQIYQYTDPVTGQVSYVDLNGQQYLDPSNPQHQQLLMQQTNPQLVAQQTNKQNIMSLYSQPNNFTTNVAVPQGQQQGVQSARPSIGQQSLSQQSIGQQSLGQQNFSQQSLPTGGQNMGQNMAQQGIQNFGQQNFGQQNLGQQTMGQMQPGQTGVQYGQAPMYGQQQVFMQPTVQQQTGFYGQQQYSQPQQYWQ